MRGERPAATRLSEVTAGQVSRMCADLAELPELVGEEARAALARLRVPAAGEDQARRVLAEIEELLRRHGLTGAWTAGRGPQAAPGGPYQPLPGLAAARPVEEVLVCPGDLCDRVEIPRAGAGQPQCAVWQCPLPPFRMEA
ncbi:hypothetical protein AMK16_20245 [Streptomyces sp. CB00455]|uniref:hypothetical protein n=1 Tax=Streptomyces sp. CB00455 TaxID=1703927 RepID=UPI00093A35A3|nr:hypothetical protein [Streptomyces sp. CB00455]OKK17703.1 hypothetical protein AMK16_20245 [Streptomyces sp. CB00455]